MTNEADNDADNDAGTVNDSEAPSAGGGAPRSARKHRVRGVLSLLAGIVAIVGLIASVVAVWARGVLFDPTAVSSAADVALQQPAVTDSLATYLTDQIMVAVGAEDFVLSVLPPALDRLTPALVGGVRSFVHDRLEKLLTRDDVRAALVQAVETSHGALMKLLRGDGLVDGVSVVDGEVSLNLLPLLSRGLLAVQDLGLFDDATIPVFTAGGDPAQQRDELSAVLNRDLPPQFGQLVVYRSDSLDRAQQSVARAQNALVLVKRSIALLLVLTGLAFAACVLLSVRRGRTVMVLLLASAAAMIVVRALVRRVVAEAPTLVLEPGARAAVGSTINTLASGLLTAVTVLAIVGALAALAIYLTGDSKPAVAIRARAGSAGEGVGGIAAAHGDLVAIAALAAAVLVIFFAGITVVTTVVAVLLVGGGVWAMRSSAQPAADAQ